MKDCSKCKIEKEEELFSKSNFKKKFGLCKSCVATSNKEYKLKNKEKITEQRKEYRVNNKEKLNKDSLNYYYNNKEHCSLIAKKYLNNKRKINVNFKIKQNISNSINKALKRNNSSKNGRSSIKYLSYAIVELKEHIEKQFEPWMNWQNWGIYNSKTWNDNDQYTWVWNIDHIIPHSTFKYSSMEDEEFKKCWALENLRPYSAKQNLLDGNRR